MVRVDSRDKSASQRGQSLVETALVIPVVLILAFNALNFGYFFFVAITLASAPRSGVQYSVLGFSTPGELQLPPAGPSTNNTSVSWLTYEDMLGLNASTSASVQVCTKALGIPAPGTSNCQQFPNGASFPAPAADPEPTAFVLNRVDVKYTVAPLVPAAIFNLPLVPSLTFHRQVSMRAMD